MIDNEKVQTNAGVSVGAAVDAGLRSYMLKVYNYMTTGLLLTAFSGYLLVRTGFIFNLYSMGQDGQVSLNILGWIVLLAPLALVMMFSSAINSLNVRKAQLIFIAFSVLLGTSIANVLLIYTTASIFKIFAITAGTFAGMSLYGYTTKSDLTGMGSFLRMGLWGLILATLVNFILQSPMMDYVLSVIGVVIFVGLTAYDTQKIRSMYNAYDTGEVASGKAISGALMLYLDFLNLFLMLLRLFGDRR